MGSKRIFIDISGYGNSGKTAISDFLKEFNTVFSFPNKIEFELFRIPDGIIDLYHSIYSDYGLIRSNLVLNRFERLVKRIGTNQKPSNPISYFIASAYNYDALFNNQFRKLAGEYITELIGFKYTTFWPYQANYADIPQLIANKLLRKLNISNDQHEVIFTEKSHFISSTNKFIQALFDTVADKNHKIVLMNNSFDSYNPTECHKIIENSRSIIVERDPRDIYTSVLPSSDVYVPDFENSKDIKKIKQQMIAVNDVDSFIHRYKAIRGNATYDSTDSILRIRFEDFILKNELMIEKILDFTGLSEAEWTNKNQFFNPLRSTKNIGLWKKCPNIGAIKKIQQELSEYCYQI